MQSWHSVFLGLRELPKEISEFELQSFFTFTDTEGAAIETEFIIIELMDTKFHVSIR